MKKIIAIACFGLMGISLFSSCKKDWNCVCTYTAGSSQTSDNTVISKTTKSDATSQCHAKNVTLGTSTKTCEIK